jgi:hypothetical protein
MPDDGGVHDVGVHLLGHVLLGLVDQPFHRQALLALGLLAERFEDLLEPLDLALGLPHVRLDRLLQLGVLAFFAIFGMALRSWASAL